MKKQQWVGSLFLGDWHLQNGDVFTCTPEDRDFYLARSKEFLKAGVPIPVCLEHQPTVGLSHHERMADQTKNTIGHCHDVRIGKRGELQYLIDGDDQTFGVLRRNKYVSPEIRVNVIDPRTGKRFSGPSIVHLACTPRPVQITGDSHLSLSSAGAGCRLNRGRTIRLSDITADLALSTTAYSPPAKAPLAKAIRGERPLNRAVMNFWTQGHWDDYQTAVALSAGTAPPKKAPARPERPLNRAIMNRLTGGRYDEYLAEKAQQEMI